MYYNVLFLNPDEFDRWLIKLNRLTLFVSHSKFDYSILSAFTKSMAIAVVKIKLMEFAVDQLEFQSTNNTKFTVTFAIDAVAKDITDIS